MQKAEHRFLLVIGGIWAGLFLFAWVLLPALIQAGVITPSSHYDPSDHNDPADYYRR